METEKTTPLVQTPALLIAQVAPLAVFGPSALHDGPPARAHESGLRGVAPGLNTDRHQRPVNNTHVNRRGHTYPARVPAAHHERPPLCPAVPRTAGDESEARKSIYSKSNGVLLQMCFASVHRIPAVFGAGRPNQNTPLIQHEARRSTPV